MKAAFLLFFLPLQVVAQDLAGVWTGFLHTSETHLPYELVISGSKDKINGYTLTIFIIEGVENVGVKSVKIKNKKGNILIEDDDLIYNNYTTPPKRVKLYGTLELKMEDSVMILSGSFITRSLESKPYAGTIQLQKQKPSSETKLIAILDEMNLSNSLSFIPPKIKEDMAIVPVMAETKTPPIKKRETEKKSGVASEQPRPIVPTITEKVAIKPAQASVTPKSPAIEKEPKKEEAINLPPETAKKVQLPPEKNQKKQEVVAPGSAAAKVVIKPAPPAIKSKASTEKQPIKDEAIASIPVTVKKVQSVSGRNQKKAETVTPATARKRQVDIIVPDNTAAELDTRNTEVIQSVFFKSDSLVLTLYDNGQIDGDTVSVVLNGKVIMARQGLTANAITTTIYITPDLGDSLQLIMYAENLGAIPPNTGLLIIQDGNDKHNIRFAGDFQKSSAITLRRRR
ncbi:MAG: hypothetical protein ABR502_06555 [Chitinophagaceae bacterium]